MEIPPAAATAAAAPTAAAAAASSASSSAAADQKRERFDTWLVLFRPSDQVYCLSPLSPCICICNLLMQHTTFSSHRQKALQQG